MGKIDLLSLLPGEIAAHLPEEPQYRAAQIFEWLHRANVFCFDEMENLPKKLRGELGENFFVSCAEVERKLTSCDDGTEKFLLRLGDVLVEAVKMTYKHGDSVCVSTQAGCKMGCKFCASADVFQRDLSAGEICAQVYAAGGRRAGRASDSADTCPTPSVLSKPDTTVGRISNIVLMGCGEPLDNFDATLRFIELITHGRGKNIGARHITVSTCGLVPRILELAERGLQITLAVSLHAPDDEIRREIMPIANAYPLGELLDACRFYAEKTRRRLTFEYALARGVNDAPAQAKALAKLLRGLLCHVNLIPVNEARGGFLPSPAPTVKKFAEILSQNKIPVTVRRSMGGDINAACGQLRAGSM